MTVIYWFRQDRRLSDNPALSQAAQFAPTLLPVALKQIPETTAWGFERYGPHRQGFEAQSWGALAQSLTQRGSDLYQPLTPGIAGLIELATQVDATQIICQTIAAPQERAQVDALRAAGLQVIELEQAALLQTHSLPFEVSQTPNVFSEFRRQVNQSSAQPRTPLAAPERLPPLPKTIKQALPYVDNLTLPTLDARSAFAWQTEPWHASEVCAQAHLQRYFDSPWPQRYKQTRNQLSGTHESTKFSPWLAIGAISAPQIWQALKEHERRFGANDSTDWIGFELLWRDHFRLVMERHGARLFHRLGLKPAPDTKRANSAQGFERWRQSQTGHSLIDAGMRELLATGYLSNRMRQIVASYLIHEMQGDWLAGAAWFEHCLIDFDVHSNQGNWAYIAGVGTDPRGGRRFNPDKQAQEHDPQGAYRELWSHA